MKLHELEVNKTGLIRLIGVSGLQKERLLSLGFIKNSAISSVRKDNKDNLTVYEICHNLVALRKEDAGKIEVDLYD